MKHPAAKEKKRPVKELRDQLRRGQIVSAAQNCVVRHGFHAASMGQIAAEAQMSVGQIYRYFPSKESIIHAIVERIVAKRLQWMLNREKQVNFAAVFAQRGHFRPGDEDDRILMLEITAEATRNSAVAEIVREADRRIRSQAVTLVRADYPELTEREAAARVELMSVLAEGTASRYVTEQVIDPELMEHIYADTLRKLFPRMTTSKLG
ncbi:MAG: TetR/AcrR family transcriptional regulator [Steroidobacter sp.]